MSHNPSIPDVTDKTRYKSPPIVERIVGVYHEIPQERFEERLPSWQEKISADYPVSAPVPEWLIDIENRNGVPFVKSLAPKARLIQVYWKPHPKQLKIHGMRVCSNRLLFHLCREENNSHDFDELMPEMERWLPLWMDHFGVPDMKAIKVHYVNRLNATVTPQLVDAKGAIAVGKALNVFATFSDSAKGMMAPYECKVTLVMDEKKPMYMDLHVQGESGQGNSVRVDFAVRVEPPGRTLSASEALAEIREGHEVLLRQFSCFFTDEAKSSFA